MLLPLLPLHCAVCRSVGPALCPRCAAQLVPPPDQPPPPGLAAAEALFSYEGAGRRVVAALKFHDHRDALEPLAALLAERVAATAVPDLVTWVPTTPARRRERGYDQARLLAAAVAAALGRPCRPTLRRVGAHSQAGRGREERLAARFEVAGRHRARAAVPTVALVDDVRTTGGSLAAAAAALRVAGAGTVVGATLAATP